MEDSFWISTASSRVLISLYFIFVPVPIKYPEKPSKKEMEKGEEKTKTKSSNFSH